MVVVMRGQQCPACCWMQRIFPGGRRPAGRWGTLDAIFVTDVQEVDGENLTIPWKHRWSPRGKIGSWKTLTLKNVFSNMQNPSGRIYGVLGMVPSDYGFGPEQPRSGSDVITVDLDSVL